MFGLIPRRKEKRLWPYEPPMELLRREFAPIFERMFGRWPAFAETEGLPPCRCADWLRADAEPNSVD